MAVSVRVEGMGGLIQEGELGRERLTVVLLLCVWSTQVTDLVQ